MIELTWMQMAHPHFQNAVGVIWDSPNMDGKTSYTASRIMQKLQKIDAKVKALRIDLCKKYGQVDDKGNLINDNRGFIVFKNPEDSQKFEEEFQSIFTSRKEVLKVNKIQFSALQQVSGLTPRMWEHLELITEGLPAAEPEAEEEETEPAPSPELAQEA